MKRTDSLYKRCVLNPWAWEIFRSFILAGALYATAAYFKTFFPLYFIFAFLTTSGIAFQFWRQLKKRGRDTGTLKEINPEMYLMKLDDGTELRVPKNSRWLIVERENGNASRALFCPVLEFNAAADSPVPAPAIKTQAPRIVKKSRALFRTLLIAALLCWISGSLGDKIDTALIHLKFQAKYGNDASELLYSGGDGTSLKDAVVLSEKASVQTEYDYIKEYHPSENYIIQTQGIFMEGGRIYDRIDIKLFQFGKWEECAFWFDATAIYGRAPVPEEVAAPENEE